MSQQDNKKVDVEALENSASILQRKEQEIQGTNLPGGPAAKAKSFADQAAYINDEPNNSTTNKRNMKPNPETVDAAKRTIQHEEAKLYDGRNPPGGAAATAQSFADRVRREENQ